MRKHAVDCRVARWESRGARPGLAPRNDTYAEMWCTKDVGVF